MDADEKIEDGMETVKKIVELSNSKRHDGKIKLRYRLKKLSVITKDAKLVKDLSGVIEKMSNVESVEIKTGDELTVQLDTEPTPELKEEWLISELTRNVQGKRKKMGLKIKDSITLFLPKNKLFEKIKDRIENATGSKIEFGKIAGEKSEFVFGEKKYEFGIK